MIRVISLFTIFLCFNIAAEILPKTLYRGGTGSVYQWDDRHEWQDHDNNILRDYGDSVAAMVLNSRLIPNRDLSEFTFAQIPIKESARICAQERFSQQTSLATCSGFLVAEDILLTAGHCVQNADEWRNYQWVFDFKKGTQKFSRNQVYGFKKIISRKDHQSRFKIQDYALIKLQRSTGRPGLPYRTSGKVKKNTALAMIGYPLGLPLKITDHAWVQKKTLKELINPFHRFSKKNYYFNANLDAYAGNSGSPVINLETGLVEGILSNGHSDFKKDRHNDCKKSRVRKANRFHRSETVFKITRVVWPLPLQNK